MLLKEPAHDRADDHYDNVPGRGDQPEQSRDDLLNLRRYFGILWYYWQVLYFLQVKNVRRLPLQVLHDTIIKRYLLETKIHNKKTR